MFWLDANNAGDYLRRAGFAPEPPLEIDELAGGVSNVVLKVQGRSSSIVLKQSRPQLRTEQIWVSKMERIYREAESLAVLGQILPAGSVPDLIFEDRPEYILGMSAVGPHRVWKSELLDHRDPVAQVIAEQSARLLAACHWKTFGDATLKERFADQSNFWELRLEPFYVRLAPQFPALASIVDAVVERCQQNPICLTHADFSPKNILVTQTGVVLVDFETVHWGDPAFDLGFFLSHLLLKGIRSAHSREFATLCATFLHTYAIESVTRVQPALIDQTFERSGTHLALCTLARIDGASPVNYLTQPQREQARGLALRLLGSGVTNVRSALDECFGSIV